MFLDVVNFSRKNLEKAFLKAKWIKDDSFDGGTLEGLLSDSYVYTDIDSGREMLVTVLSEKKPRERVCEFIFYEFYEGGTAYEATYEKGFSARYLKGISIESGYIGFEVYGNKYYSYDILEGIEKGS